MFTTILIILLAAIICYLGPKILKEILVGILTVFFKIPSYIKDIICEAKNEANKK